MIDKVTITGADNSITPKDLIKLTDMYPFVEWGILVSKNRFGTPRYPSLEWMKELKEVKKEHDMKLSCHLCGMYVRELMKGNDIAMVELAEIWDMFERVQINFHAINHVVDREAMTRLLLKYPEKEFIFQYDDVNNEIAKTAKEAGVNCSILFDKSGGDGVLPAEWPFPVENMKCGYAGGLSPWNVEEQIELIKDKAGDLNIWIDVETHVRSINDKLFDIILVDRFLSRSYK